MNAVTLSVIFLMHRPETHHNMSQFHREKLSSFDMHNESMTTKERGNKK